MTKLLRKVIRQTRSDAQGQPIIVELHPTALFIRTKGSRESFPLTYAELYDIATRDAKTQSRLRQ
jgi:hypothetical protein